MDLLLDDGGTGDARAFSMADLNHAIADALERIADLLQAQGGDGYRVRAHREGAAVLRELDRDVGAIVADGGERALQDIPHIGRGLAAAIAEAVLTGRIARLERLEDQTSPVDLFTTIPGIGEKLARRIHEMLHLETLEDLEAAAHDGRLSSVPGFGPRRAQAVREELGSMLGRSSRRRARLIHDHMLRPDADARRERPPVSLLLEVDAHYRREARAGRLARIAPRRFNRHHRVWLPVLRCHRAGWSFSAMFSNTARAHHLGRTDDWVVIHWQREGHEDQCTVVTERGGGDVGRRVIRGRERECHEHHAAAPPGRFEIPEALAEMMQSA